MNTDNIASGLSSTTATTGTSAARAETRQRLATLAAEFESILLTNMLREMQDAGRWSEEEDADTLGADNFRQTFDTELSRYLSQSQGIGLSQQLLRAFDAAFREEVDGGTTAPPPASAAADSTTTNTNAATSGGRRGWNNMNLECPPYGGSGAQYGGFNNDRAMAGGDENSVKDGFFRWTYGLDFNPAGKSKEELGSYLRSQMASAQEYGLNILDVNLDQILIETAENGPEWVDIVQSAGSSNPNEVRWQWLPQADMGVPPPVNAAAMAFSGGSSTIPGYTPSYNGSVATFTPTAAPSPAPPPAAANDLRVPTGYVTSAYGWRQDPFNGAATFHRGVDVRGAQGDPVASAGAGKVIFSGNDGGYGRSVVIEHAGGLSTRYAHLESALVNLGDTVHDGQTIGTVGQTGRATAPHLHFEVMSDGRSVDPLK
jgi:murein DD-endopeptidase MepM/ murein hydrolase activator NlpD